ncbi:multifunctional CCA protein [Luminiphilus syltensis NOR5-1B]|uniref:Multifunctional CCA protein n=1 Tax=Luminiphilus syltensis NOR5-1B TaxID=565045 RepID=B8KVX7_9GAMM|nr:tRNA nucleotidyltransferase [Luminiphilus syltensis]EED34852.1 multifunctional CCA protein [Luminiphilus syltensis NOR5-1B]
MQVYKVGGAVRDQLLDYAFHETDWVVVGATAEHMLEQGFTQVGRDFPVFLHPDTKDEYALARTERKSGRGYHGFEVHADPSVTLEEDLQRRDLTINAMAMSEKGEVIDPYGGQRDLQARVLRHVSPHFVEDPLRVLRVARFAARYHHLNFKVASETTDLMRTLVTEGELAHLSVERIWVETERALAEKSPEVFFRVLDSCGALEQLIPDIGVADIDRLKNASQWTSRTECRWAALLSQLDATRAEHINRQFKTPKRVAALSAAIIKHRSSIDSNDASELLRLLKALDALRREEPFSGFCETVAALNGHHPAAYAPAERLRLVANSARSISARDITNEGLSGPEIGAAIAHRQIAAIEDVLVSQEGLEARRD